MEGRIGRILLEGLLNTRDLGGYVTEDGREVVPGKLIRSGALTNMTQRDRKVLFEECSVRTVIDFRTKKEASLCPEPEVEGVTFLFCPILDEETAGFTHEEEGDGQEDLEKGFLRHVKSLGGNPQAYVDKLYQSLVLDQQAARQYGVFLHAVADAGEGAVLWHCSAGKDRAGVGTALLLSVLGVPEETILEDFVKTNEYLKPETDKTVEAVMETVKSPEAAACAKVLCEVRESYLTGAFALMKREFGSVEQYVETMLGISRELKERLRDRYLTDRMNNGKK